MGKLSSFERIDFSNFDFNGSILKRDLTELSKNKIETLHIFGYSGENDGHINEAIRNNTSIDEIIYYANPKNYNDPKLKFKLERLLSDATTPNKLKIKPWTVIWNELLPE